MSSVIFRNATPSDAALLSDIGIASFVETFGHLYASDDLDDFLRAHSVDAWETTLGDSLYTAMIGEAAGIAVAYAKLGPPTLLSTPSAGAIELCAFYVLAPWHGSGVADAMMARVLRQVHARGATSLQLSVFIDNSRARRFYERYGFVRVGSVTFMVGSHADEDDVMRLEL